MPYEFHKQGYLTCVLQAERLCRAIRKTGMHTNIIHARSGKCTLTDGKKHYRHENAPGVLLHTVHSQKMLNMYMAYTHEVYYKPIKSIKYERERANSSLQGTCTVYSWSGNTKAVKFSLASIVDIPANSNVQNGY